MSADEVVLEPPGSPVTGAGSRPGREPEEGVALCLSGGGYRAMLFHAGAIWRLGELGQLARVDRISSVSGGSITASVLGLRWGELDIGGPGFVARYVERVLTPLRDLAGVTIDKKSVLGGILTPRRSIADKVAGGYRRHLLGGATLQDLPAHPRFVINATSVQTGSLWRFSRPYMGDWRVGIVRSPRVALADAVAASSAFPPVLSPFQLELDPSAFERLGALGEGGFVRRAVLSDGGVYDNLGLETAWKRYRTVLVSDGGGLMAPDADVAIDWVRHAYRVNAVIDNQVRSMRKRQLIAGYADPLRSGAYWSIRSHPTDYGPVDGSLPCPDTSTEKLAAVKTRLAALDDAWQERLVNWGYAMADIAVRRWMPPAPGVEPPTAQFPYAARGVG